MDLHTIGTMAELSMCSVAVDLLASAIVVCLLGASCSGTGCYLQAAASAAKL